MRHTLQITVLLSLGCLSAVVAAAPMVVDLTHPMPTFQASEANPMQPDLGKPWLDSQPIPSFGPQMVFSVSQFPTSDGHFDLGLMVVAEHHGTHMDTAAHYVNNTESMETGGTPPDQRELAHQVEAADLVGPVVLIDLSGRVQAELDKNGGRPSADTAVTDFSNDSPNVVTKDDIDAVADQLGDGVWLVLNLGWSDFFLQGADFAKDPYVNGWNHPGINKAAVDRLIELEDEKGFRIRGIVADNIGIDSGESGIGVDDKWTDSFHAHVRGMQRGWFFVENAANLGQLSAAEPGTCTLIVGAPRHVRGTGGPSRVMAMCGS